MFKVFVLVLCICTGCSSNSEQRIDELERQNAQLVENQIKIEQDWKTFSKSYDANTRKELEKNLIEAKESFAQIGTIRKKVSNIEGFVSEYDTFVKNINIGKDNRNKIRTLDELQGRLRAISEKNSRELEKLNNKINDLKKEIKNLELRIRK